MICRKLRIAGLLIEVNGTFLPTLRRTSTRGEDFRGRSKTLKQRDFIAASADRNVIWVDPLSITRQLGSKWPVGREKLARLRRLLPGPVVNLVRSPIKRAEPFEIPRRFLDQTMRVEDTRRHQRLENLLATRDAPRRSLWFTELTGDLQRKGVAYYKTRPLRSEAEIDAFLHEMIALADALATRGFDPRATGYESTAVIDADGMLVKTGSGNHRFCLARLVGLRRFPVQIVGAHEDWLRANVAAPVTVDAVIDCLPTVAARHAATEQPQEACA